MECKIYILIILSLMLGSCINDQSTVERYTIDYQNFNLEFNKTDSLSELFREKQFQAVIDTFHFESDSSPTVLSSIEYYSISTYSVSNIKCIMVGGKAKGVICLFKYNYQKEIWELEWQTQTTIDKIKQRALALKNSIYWLQSDLTTHDNRFIGDFFRFSYLDGNEKFTRLNISPDMELIDQFKALVE